MLILRAISADSGSFSIKICPSGLDNDDACSTLWVCSIDDAYSNNETDSVIYSSITTEDGEIEVAYAVLSNATEATVQFHLNGPITSGPSTERVRVHGEITAHSPLFGGKGVLLFSRTKEEELEFHPSSDGSSKIPIPLALPVVAVPLDLPFQIKVTGHAACFNYENSISTANNLVFPLVCHDNIEANRFCMAAKLMPSVL